LPLYYGDGGPGPHTKLLRVDYDGDDEVKSWFGSPAYRWAPHNGWQPYPQAQSEIRWTGEFGLVDVDEVPQIREQYARYRIA
jgi:hypothetical protein